jgi:hypothetical protein
MHHISKPASSPEVITTHSHHNNTMEKEETSMIGRSQTMETEEEDNDS